MFSHHGHQQWHPQTVPKKEVGGERRRKCWNLANFPAFTNISEETVTVLISINVHLMLVFKILTVNLNPRLMGCVFVCLL